MTPQELFRVRIALVQAGLANQNLDGVLLNRVDNFAAATGGKRSYIWTYADPGANALAVTRDGRGSRVYMGLAKPAPILVPAPRRVLGRDKRVNGRKR